MPCLLLLACCAGAPAAWAGDRGVYFGGTFGSRYYDNGCQPAALSCDREDSAWGLAAGFRFDPHWSVELGYLDLGAAHANYPRLTHTLEVTGRIDGYDLSALWGIPAGEHAQAFLRLGAFRWSAETRSAEFSFDAQGWSVSAGFGLEWAAGSWRLRGQFLYLDDLGDTQTGRANGLLATLGASYFFPLRQ